MHDYDIYGRVRGQMRQIAELAGRLSPGTISGQAADALRRLPNRWTRAAGTSKPLPALRDAERQVRDAKPSTDRDRELLATMNYVIRTARAEILYETGFRCRMMIDELDQLPEHGLAGHVETVLKATATAAAYWAAREWDPAKASAEIAVAFVSLAADLARIETETGQSTAWLRGRAATAYALFNTTI